MSASLICSDGWAAGVKINSGDTNNLSNSGRMVVRASGGNIYVVMLDSTITAVKVYLSSNGGVSWTEQDTAHRPTGTNYKAPSVAIDSSDVLHIAYWDNTTTTGGLRYVTFGSGAYSGDTLAVGLQATTSNPGTAISIDSAGKSHIAYVDHKTTFDTVYYTNNVSGSWATRVEIEGSAASHNCQWPDITMDQNDLPEISHYQASTPLIMASLGNVNSATSFSVVNVNAAGVNSACPTISIDPYGNSWIAFGDDGGTVGPALIEHLSTDGWSTWQTTQMSGQTSIVSGKITHTPIGQNIFLINADATGLNLVDTKYYAPTFFGPTTIAAIASAFPSSKWAYRNDNQRSVQIDFVYASGSDIYWDKITPPVPTTFDAFLLAGD